MIKNLVQIYWPYLFLAALSGLIIWPLFMAGYFSHHDDLQVMRVFEMRRCFEDLQIPCRWAADMGFGNGYPLFNYYSALPYYIGGFFTYIFGFVGAAKILFFLPLFLGGFFMYILGNELFGKYPGLTAAVLFMFAPYRALDSYVRGDVSESFAIALIPLVFWVIVRLAKKVTLNNFLMLSFVTGLFLLSHNIMSLIFTPLFFIWALFWNFKFEKKNFLYYLGSLVFSVTLSAFFILPAFLEKSLVQVDSLTQGYLNFRAQFATLEQLFLSTFWGYGASLPGPNDTISFQIGWPHWWLAMAVAIVVVLALVWPKLNFLDVKKVRSEKWLVLGILAAFLVSVFMAHNRSAFVWERLPLLRFAQFPWRFLSLSIITASLLGGALTGFFKGKVQTGLAVVIIILAVALNWAYFKPEHFYNVTDKDKLSGQEWTRQIQASILDYLPKTAVEPREPAPETPLITSGAGQVIDFKNYSNRWQFTADIEKEAVVEMPVFDFPNWTVFVDGQNYYHNHKNYLGRIQISLHPGKYNVVGRFENTPLRTVSDWLSLVSLILLTGLFIYGHSIKKD